MAQSRTLTAEETLSPEDLEEASPATVNAAVSEYRRLYRNPMLSEKTQRSYEQMLDDPHVRGNIVSIQENIQWLQETIKDANRYRERFISDLNTAVTNKWIGNESKQRWLKRFDDPSVLEWDRKEWISNEFPKYLQNWAALGKRHQAVLEKAKRAGVDLSSVDGLQPLFDQHSFLNADYDVKVGLVLKAESALEAGGKDMEKGWKSVQSLLMKLTVGKDACLHSSKVGTWLKRVFGACDTPQEVQDYLDEVLMPAVANWKEATVRFETLHAQGIPPSFKAVSKERFLKWHYDDRMAYLEELDLSRQAAERKESTALDRDKKSIRYDIATEDFANAEAKLLPLLAEHPADPDLLSLKRTLTLRGPKEEDVREAPEAVEAAQLLSELRSLVSLIPSSMRWMYEEAMQDGPATLRRLQQVVYNRKWARDNGYSNEVDEVREANSVVNKEDTRNYVEEGHTDDFERIVVKGDTAKEAAIRDECKEAQVLYADTEDCRPIMTKIADNKDNEDFGYWTTLVFNDVAYDRQAGVIQNVHYPLLSRVRKLEAMGIRYTPSGAVRAEKTTAQVAETPHAMAA